jgi:hypothetical protein
MKTTSPVPQTDWFPATNDPAIIGRVVLVKMINEAESKKQRTQVYFTYPAIEHKAAGIQGDVSFALVREEIDPDTAEHWKQRFAKAWSAFKGSENSVPEGTPLADFDEIPDSKIAEFKLHGLTTVEQLANISDAVCDSIGMGARKWRTNAQRFLKKRANSGYGYNVAG